MSTLSPAIQRSPRGTTTGGQFTRRSFSEPGISLTPAPDTDTAWSGFMNSVSTIDASQGADLAALGHATSWTTRSTVRRHVSDELWMEASEEAADAVPAKALTTGRTRLTTNQIQGVRDAVADAAIALRIRHLADDGNAYGELSRPWALIMGRLHPDDDTAVPSQDELYGPLGYEAPDDAPAGRAA